MKSILTLLLLSGIGAAYLYLPAQTPEKPAPAQAQHHFSEPGVAYTTDYVALRLASGVVGIAPGTRLTECLDVHVPDKAVVNNGTYTFTVDPRTLTHDIDLAHQLAAADQQDQAHAVSSLTLSQQERAANQHTANLLTAQDVDQVNAEAVASSTVGSYDASLHQPVATVGAAGGYGGFYYGGDTTIINNVSVNRFGGAGVRDATGAGASVVARASKFAAPRPAPGRGITGPATGSSNASGTGFSTR